MPSKSSSHAEDRYVSVTQNEMAGAQPTGNYLVGQIQADAVRENVA